MLLLLTGARRREITQAKWEYVDWEKRVLLVPVSKSGRPRIVALNAAAFALLRSIPRDPEFPVCIPQSACGTVLSVGPHSTPCRAARCSLAWPSPLVRKLTSETQGVSLYIVQGLLRTPRRG